MFALSLVGARFTHGLAPLVFRVSSVVTGPVACGAVVTGAVARVDALSVVTCPRCLAAC